VGCYWYTECVNDFLKTTTLVMLVAPSAMGKSTIMDAVLQLDPAITRVRGFTTRPPRPDDRPDQFYYLTTDELAAKRAAREIVSEVTSPTTGYSYGTLLESYQSSYCILETLANSVVDYRALPFGRTVTISLTAPCERWQAWFHARYLIIDDDARLRMQEAKLSTRWSLEQHTDHTWLVNDGTPLDAAQRLVSIVRGTSRGDDGTPHARAIMEVVSREDYP